jgi:SAM-dependent methyltransferase
LTEAARAYEAYGRVVGGEPRPLADQLAYYRARASECGGGSIDAPGHDELQAAIESFSPTGDVLELACGPGAWTERLLRTAASVTAVDAAPELLNRACASVDDAANVRFVEADVFSWRPERRYDAVCFGFWISHVPDDRFESFWAMVDEALTRDGEVFFFDDNDRPNAELVYGPESQVVQRRLGDGRSFDVVKMPWEATALEDRLRRLGWDITVTPTAGPFYWAAGTR